MGLKKYQIDSSTNGAADSALSLIFVPGAQSFENDCDTIPLEMVLVYEMEMKRKKYRMDEKS